MFNNLFIYGFLFIFLISCSNTQTRVDANKKEINLSPDKIYITAMNNFNNEKFVESKEQFELLQKLFPLSNEAIQAEIMIGFLFYVQMDYNEAISQFNKIIRKYPSHKDIDYIYYMIGMCNYEQIENHELDGAYNELALESFNQVILRFPKSEYAKDSRQKIILVKTNKAAKHMAIGRYYLKEKKYTAALNRFKVVIEDYSVTKFTPEALHRMVEAYYEMGMIDESIETASVLGYNYPDSLWYRHSYNLIKKENKNGSIVKKITDFF